MDEFVVSGSQLSSARTSVTSKSGTNPVRPNSSRQTRPPSSGSTRSKQSNDSTRSSINKNSAKKNETVSRQATRRSVNGNVISEPPERDMPDLNLAELSARSNADDLKSLVDNSKPWAVKALQSSERRISSAASNAPGIGLPDDFLRIVNRAAATIQIWYRYRLSIKRKAEAAKMKELLAQKKAEKEAELKKDLQKSGQEGNLRLKSREAAKREERRQAIEELKKKREERAKEAFEKAQEDMKAISEKKKSAKKAQQKKPDEAESKQDVPGNDTPATEIAQSESAENESFRAEDALNNESDAFSNSMASSKSTTIDDLFETLKQLEEPEDIPENPKTTKFIVENTDDDMGFSARSSSRNSAPANAGGDRKMNEIMQFLDSVEKEEAEVLSQRMSKSKEEGDELDFHPDTCPPPVLVPSAEELMKLQDANRVAAEVNDSLLQQRMEVAQKSRSIEMLQKALNQQRELTVRHAKEQERENKRRLNELKSTLETKISRQTAFIDQLIESNSKLSEKCQTLTSQVKDAVTAHEKKLKHMTESHEAEKKKLKETLSAAEKIRREKWMEEQTRNLKDITVKGLEPEIQKLIQQHKNEMRKLKTLHDAEIAQADERAAHKYMTEKEMLKESLARELEQACAKERELAKQRYEKMMEQEEMNFQTQRKRLYNEVQEEKSRVNEIAQRQRQELDLRQKQLEESNRKMMEDMRREYEKARLEQEHKHAQEISEIERKCEVEKQSWEEHFRKEQESLLMQKERELTEKVRQGRDKEIELVIQRLEADMEKSRAETEKTAENRIKRIREKYESELRELEAVERSTTERYNNLRGKYGELEGENARLKTLVKERDHDLEQITKIKEKLTRERDSMSDVIRQEFADRLVSTEDENRRLKNEMSELKAKNKLEIDRITRDKEEEMAEVHKRIKQALVKKEEIVSQIKAKYEAAEKRADHLESLLESLRKQHSVNTKSK